MDGVSFQAFQFLFGIGLMILSGLILWPIWRDNPGLRPRYMVLSVIGVILGLWGLWLVYVGVVGGIRGEVL